MAELQFTVEAPLPSRTIDFPERSFTIGSDPACLVAFSSTSIAPQHAEVVRDTRGQWWIRDLTGAGGVLLNGNPIIDERLSPGDTLRVGDAVLTVKDPAPRTISQDGVPTGLIPIPPPEAPVDLAPETIVDGRYRVLKKLASGGMGEVYRAEHIELGKPLAIKVMLPELSRDPEFVARFKREAIASSRIGQQNIIDISDFGQLPDGRFYFVMEFVDGKTLVKYRREGPFTFDRVLHVGLQIARALAAAHAVGIVHRDLTPDNVMLVQRTGQPDFVKVLDFGLASSVGPLAPAGLVAGSPQYMAPEQIKLGTVDARTDVYVLGLMLHELIRGKPTFTADTMAGLMKAQLEAPPPKFESPLGPVPRALEQIIAQMLEKNPAQRPASMEAVVTALDAVASYPTPTFKTGTAMAALDRQGARTARMSPVDTRTPATRTEPMPRPVLPPTPPPRPTLHPDELNAIRPNRPMSWWMAGLTVVVVGLGFALWFTRPSAPMAAAPLVVVEPTPVVTPRVVAPVEPIATQIKLTLETDPERAEVLEDDVLLGATPMTLTRPQGSTTTLRFEARGFAPVSRKLRFEADSTLRFELDRTDGVAPPTEKTNAKPPIERGLKPPPPPEDGDLKDAPF